MAVIKNTITALAPYTVKDLANLFRQSFIDAGMMTEWHDSFLSNPVENRVLKVTYDATKKYGTMYYWFKFQPTGVWVNYATGWNTVTHVPTGTPYYDYYTTTTNNVNNFYQIISTSTSVDCAITRYTSGVNPLFSWFLIRNGTTTTNFYIPHSGTTVQSWINLDKHSYGGLMQTAIYVDTIGGSVKIGFWYRGSILRNWNIRNGRMTSGYGSYDLGGTDNSISNADLSTSYFWGSIFYYTSNSGVNATVGRNYAINNETAGLIYLPVGYFGSGGGGEYASTVKPVFSGLPIDQHVTNTIPSDFGITGYTVTNTMGVQDRLIVTSGIEEWEIIGVVNATNTARDSGLWLARTT